MFSTESTSDASTAQRTPTQEALENPRALATAASGVDPLTLDTQKLKLRRMREADVDSIMTIESVSFGRHHWSEDSFLSEMRNQMGRYYSLVYEADEATKLVGYCGYWVIIDEAHITTLAVHPQYRGLSLGELQLLHILNRCASHTIHWATLEVRASNFSAQNLYYKYGFRVAGVRPKYYQDNGENALIMTTPKMNTEDYRQLLRENQEKFLARFINFPEGFDR